MTPAQNWNFEFDVIVVGSGAGGMTAGLIAHDLGLKALVIEKSDLIGGTTAVSAGVIWIPNNPRLSALGYPDSEEDALSYLKATLKSDFDDEKVRAYLETGPQMVDYLEKNSEIVFGAAPLPDYYSNLPGGKDKYRALDPLPLNGRRLGDDKKLLRPPHAQLVVAGMMFTTGEVATILRKDTGWLALILGQLVKQNLDLPWRLKHHSSPRLTLGNALTARCLLSLQQRKIPVWRETALTELVTNDEGTVTGIVAKQGDKTVCLKANKGVILATGGFSANPQMRKTYLKRAPDTAHSVAPDINMGDGIAAGRQVGAETDLMDDAWWIPAYRPRASGPANGMFLERAFPGCMIINQRGERFTNDAANYDHTGRAMANLSENGDSNNPCYFVFDGRFRQHYIAGPLQASPPFIDRFWRDDVKKLIIRENDIPSLASRISVDPVTLEGTIDRFNQQAKNGKDTDFARGEERYDRHYGDPKIKPNSTMAPITKPPFYAIPVFAGDIGTKGGLVTDKDAQVMDTEGQPIRGLYAIGNTSASIMGHTYPGGGVTIGPSMVFGARAAMHLANRGLEP